MEIRTNFLTNETSERKDVEVLNNDVFKKNAAPRTPPSSVVLRGADQVFTWQETNGFGGHNKTTSPNTVSYIHERSRCRRRQMPGKAFAHGPKAQHPSIYGEGPEVGQRNDKAHLQGANE
jgi:hypothetical protein